MKPPVIEIIWPGLAAGLFWGLSILGLEAVFALEKLEGSWLELLFSFSVGGAFMGALAAGTGALTGMQLRSYPYRSAFQSTLMIWGISVLGGATASWINPERYHLNGAELLSGGFKAALLGAILGWILSRYKEKPGAATGLE
ncbi:MAG TPA: hypothetical protein VN944_09500 [Nitrospiria bacterium]|nr:hypothetical protein [Nitrospiria bacterium]